MMLLTLPAELLLDIVQYIPTIRDKCQLLQTCTLLNHLLCTHVACWTHLDLSPYSTLSNGTLLTFLNRNNIKLFTSTGTAIHGISLLDLSGCWCLSQDMIVALSKSFSSLDKLFLNGYRLNDSKKGNNSIAFEQQRDHLYQVRPSHDLSSMAMDLSKKSNNRLKIPFVLISYILSQVPCITSLSVQYQDLSPPNRTSFSEFSHIQHLDISSCTVSQPTLQSLLRKIASGLISLKMLNIELNNLTWLCLGQFCKKLTCLHVSCIEPIFLPCIRRAVSNLKELQDFRLTRVRTGTIDPIIEILDSTLLKRLDLSPKMNIYPKGGGKHPTQPSISNYATTDHDLQITDVSLHHLSKCHNLVELRLCFPTISSGGLHALLRSIPQLEVFELRQQENKEDYLKGLKYLINLNRIYLYSVFISIEAMDTLTNLPLLNHLTVTQGGQFIDENRLLNQCKSLKSFDLGRTRNISYIKRDNHWHTL